MKNKFSWIHVQFSHSVVANSLRPHGLQHARPSCPSQLLEFTQTHGHWAGDAIQPSHILSSPFPPAFNLSQHQSLYKWVSSSHQVAKVLVFQLQHQSFHEYSGLISFRMDWLDLLAVQGTLKNLLQHHSSKASILWHSGIHVTGIILQRHMCFYQNIKYKVVVVGGLPIIIKKKFPEELLMIWDLSQGLPRQCQW